MIRLTISQHHNYHHYLINNNNNQISSSSRVLIFYQQLSKFVFHCLLLLSLIYSVQSESNLTTTKSIETTTTISLIDSDDLTTSYTFLNPIGLGDNLSLITESSTIVDLIETKETTIGYNLTADNIVDHNETIITTIKPKIDPALVSAFLDGADEVNNLPTIKLDDGNPNTTDSESITSNEIINPSSLPTTINPNVIFKSPTLLNTIKDNQETTPTINSNQPSSMLIDLESPTPTPTPTLNLTTDMVDTNDTTINSTVINQLNNETILPSSSITTTDLLIDKTNQTICDSNNNQIADHVNHSRLTIDHYEARKFFLFTMILLGLCCLLILIVLILVLYIFRKLTRERTIKIQRVANKNLTNSGGSIEFDTIKDGRFYQWQGNVNSGFDSGDCNESTTQSTGYRFLEGSVVPYDDRYHNDMKTSSTETFGHHHHHHHHHHNNQTNHNLNLNPTATLSTSSSINSLPKAITTVDTRL